MTDTKILKELSNLIGDFVEGLIKETGIPTIKTCIVESSDGNGKYTVNYGNTRHFVRGKGTYPAGNTVEVMLPKGSWNRAFIVY